MKIYLDLILLLNFSFDFLLLLSVSVILRRNVKLRKVFLGAFVGALSIFFLFMKINSLTLFIYKFIISIFMVIITFRFKNIRYTLKNLFYLYITSIVLGGFLYFLNVEFSYKQVGLVFYHSGLSINFIVLIITSPIILYIYIKQALYLKNNYSNYYKVDIYLKDGSIRKVNAFLDTGNKLVDPYKRRPIILVTKEQLKFDYKNNKILLVPYDGINSHGLLKCIEPLKINIHGVGIKKNLLIGLSEENISIDGINCILHTKLLEE